MPRLVVVSSKPYRGFLLELRDGGGERCAVVVHPPAGRGEPEEVRLPPGEPTRLPALLARAREMVDAVLGPRPRTNARFPRSPEATERPAATGDPRPLPARGPRVGSAAWLDNAR